MLQFLTETAVTTHHNLVSVLRTSTCYLTPYSLYQKRLLCWKLQNNSSLIISADSAQSADVNKELQKQHHIISVVLLHYILSKLGVSNFFLHYRPNTVHFDLKLAGPVKRSVSVKKSQTELFFYRMRKKKSVSTTLWTETVRNGMTENVLLAHCPHYPVFLT